jgi:hypothetical protein
LQVWYIDPNGVETLWVGREDGSAWPAVGYKEFSVTLSYTGIVITIITMSDQVGGVTWARTQEGIFTATKTGAFPKTNLGGATTYMEQQIVDEEGLSQKVGLNAVGTDGIRVANFVDGALSDDQISSVPISIRIYP